MQKVAQRLPFYAGLGLVTAATLMLQIVETRIISVTSWYHLAFFIISIAMFGLTAGAVWVYLRSEAFTSQFLGYHLSVASLSFALATVFALLVQLTIVTSLPASAMSFVVWAEFAIALALPFFFSGIVVSLALTRSPYPVGIVYGADLLGAAFGCLGALVLLNLVSGPSAVLWVAALIAAGGLSFASGGGQGAPSHQPIAATLFRFRTVIFGALVLLAAANSLTEGIRPTIVKDNLEQPATIAYEKWNSFSRITIGQNQVTSPVLWGPSPRYVPQQVDQRWMHIDGGAGTAVYRFTGDLQEMAFLRFDVTNLAYAIPGLKTGAVIGVGGGRDLLSARLFGLPEVVGIEINPIFIDLLTQRYADYTTIGRQPGITFQVDEARSWFARATRSFDIIQMSLIDTWAATGAGAFTLSENGLYTVEAWRIFLQRLTPDGVFTVSRWYAPGEVNETGRMVSLAVATLQDLGIPDPKRHLFMGSSGSVATLVMSRSPLSEQALAELRRTAATYDFSVLLDPAGQAASPLLESIVSAPDRHALRRATEASYLDLSAPTDARPFFFNQLRLDRLLDQNLFALASRPGVYGGNLSATLTLAMLILISAVLVAATIIIPLRSTVSTAATTLTVAGTAYFALIGIGFMMVEIALLQRISVFLGHPVYALSVVLFSLILSTGVGSLASERFPLNDTKRLVAWPALTCLYLVALPLWLPEALLRLESAGLLPRAGLAVLVLAPAGFLMGFGFPTGMRLVSVIDKRPTPWFWGINGAAGVLAASIAVLTSIEFGIDTTLRVGAFCYLLLPGPALLLVRYAEARRERTDPGDAVEPASFQQVE
ncbi:class I SAM-dependent methyltransferase [Microvirga brassicacearum]|uniref:Class I SAM-dependent methyltransferase n=1 Tax=Microvirga brassicacearum TaxID=2580413 RepID=A0A5N3P892_9HYPH|nr:class I SAM-dependent methyltransferase [Microvirga brassicacearum]KAB0265946.1 class I SAM-dependent methyltransferase [Microvirga brassicacearum]